MKKWEEAALVVQTLATAEQQGDRRMNGNLICKKSGLSSGAVYNALAVLEGEGIVEGRFHRLTVKAHRVEEVLPILFSPRMGASRVTAAIVVALQLALDGPSDGWVSGDAIATVLRVSPAWINQGPVHEMNSALVRLGDGGLLESRNTTAPNRGPERRDYRLRLAWALARPTSVFESRELLDTCRRDELPVSASGDVEVYWVNGDEVVAEGHFGSSGASVHVAHAGRNALLDGNDAWALRYHGTHGGQAANAAEPPDRG